MDGPGRRVVVVLGGGVAGLSTALAFGEAGWDVVVVEQDGVPAPPSPGGAFSDWDRPSVPQFRQSHAFLPRLRLLLAARAPDVLAALHEAGAVDMPAAERRPATLEDYVEEPGDEDLTALACRRTTFEWVLRTEVTKRSSIELLADRVVGLVLDERHETVRGAQLERMGEVLADLVVDAQGARSAVPRWLRDAGWDDVVDATESPTGIVYATRFYERRPCQSSPSGPLRREIGPVLVAVFPADHGAFSVTVVVPGGDAELRGVVRADAFDAVVGAIEVTAPWVDPAHATPLTEVQAMGSLTNRIRGIVRDGRPTVHGLALVGDAAVRSNPVHGAGCTMAVVQAYALADLCAEKASLDVAVVAFDEVVQREVVPWHDAGVSARDLRLRDDPAARTTRLLQRGFRRAMEVDADVWRRAQRVANLLAPPESLRDPRIQRRVMELAASEANPTDDVDALAPVRSLIARSR